MSNQLLFEPRRLRVWLAKAAAVFVASLVVTAVVIAAWWAAVWLLAGARDVQASGHVWATIAASAARGSLLAAGAAVGGYALTMFFRSTVATLGVMFAVAVAGQAVFVAVLGNSAMRWVLPTNIAAYLFNGYDYYDGTSSQECVDMGNGAVQCGGGTTAPQPGLRGDVPPRPARHRGVPLRVVVPAPRRALTARVRGHLCRNWVPLGPGVG